MVFNPLGFDTHMMRYIISALRETVSAQPSFACDSLRHAAVAMLSSEAIPLLKVRHLAGAGTSGKYTAIRRCIGDARATPRGLPQRGALHELRRLRWRIARAFLCFAPYAGSCNLVCSHPRGTRASTLASRSQRRVDFTVLTCSATGFATEPSLPAQR
jgi:hypothetical protein